MNRQDQTRFIAEGMGNFARIDMDGDVLIYKESGAKDRFRYQDKFNPFENDSDNHKALIWAIKEFGYSRFDDTFQKIMKGVNPLEAIADTVYQLVCERK